MCKFYSFRKFLILYSLLNTNTILNKYEIKFQDVIRLYYDRHEEIKYSYEVPCDETLSFIYQAH